MSAKMGVEAHYVESWGDLMARMVVKESTSRMRGKKPKWVACCTTKKAACASPWFAPIGGRRLELTARTL